MWWQLIHYYTFLIRKHKPTMKLDSRLFQFTFARNCQISKRPWLRLLLPADISRQLLRPGPLFFKSEWYHYIFGQSFVLLNVDSSLVFFSSGFGDLTEISCSGGELFEVEVSEAKKNVTTVDGRIKCNCYWWPHFDVEASPSKPKIQVHFLGHSASAFQIPPLHFILRQIIALNFALQ